MAKKNNLFKLPLRNKVAVDRNRPPSINNGILHSTTHKDYFEMAVKILLNALKCKDDYTWGHSLRVAYFCISVGRELGLSGPELYELEISALFHDIGKIGVPDSVLQKPARLSEEEFLEMKAHPVKSYLILKDFPIFHNMALGAKHHHERYDGRGYPDQLKGENIPLFSRIILIADTFDAMTSTRPYRKGLSFDIAFSELREFAGSQFDPKVVEAFIKAIAKEQNKNEETFSLQIIEGDFLKNAA